MKEWNICPWTWTVKAWKANTSAASGPSLPLIWKWQILGINLAWSSSYTPRAIYWIWISEHSIVRINVKFFCQNSYLFKSFLKWVPTFRPAACWSSPKTQVNLPYYWVISCWDGLWPAGLCFAVRVWGENTSILFGQPKYFYQELRFWQSYRDIGYLP